MYSYSNRSNFGVLAQEFKRSNIWIVGLDPPLKFDFNESLKIDSIQPKYNAAQYFGTSCISDSNGSLLFFCSGFIPYSVNAIHLDSTAYKGHYINSALGDKFITHEGGNGYWNQQSLILPKRNNEYYVFTTGMSDAAFDWWQQPTATWDSFGMDVLTYHIVDMDKNNGKGGVTSKNNILIHTPYLSHCMMQAVRHGNGKDWWLMKPAKDQHKFYTFPVKEDTILGPNVQEFNFPNWDKQHTYGQSVFSAKGDQFAFVTESNRLPNVRLYDFDRCNGSLSNYRNIPLPQDTTKDDWLQGVAFSDNGKFLYANTHYFVYQIDLQESLLTPTLVGSYLQPYPKMQNCKLAPDGNIYILAIKMA